MTKIIYYVMASFSIVFDRNKERIPSDGSVSMCHIIDSQKPSLCSGNTIVVL